MRFLLVAFLLSVAGSAFAKAPALLLQEDGSKQSVVSANADAFKCEYNKKSIAIKLNDEHTQKFAEYTENNIGKRVNAYFCGNIVASPTINAKINSGVIILPYDVLPSNAHFCVTGNCEEKLKD